MIGVVKDIKYRSLAESPRPYLSADATSLGTGNGFSCMYGRWDHRSSSYPSCGAN